MTAFTTGLKTWINEVTTGHAAALAAPILAAYFGGQMSGPQAATALFGALILAIWPEGK